MPRGLKYTATRIDIVNSFYDEVHRLFKKYEFQREAILALDEIESLACWWANAPATRIGICSTCRDDGRVLRFYARGPNDPRGNIYVGCPDCSKGRAYDEALRAVMQYLQRAAAMPSGLPPRERAIRALYGPHYDPAFVRPGVVTDDVEAAIRAAVAEERERCAKIADEYAANAKEDRSVWAAEAIADLIRRAQL